MKRSIWSTVAMAMIAVAIGAAPAPAAPVSSQEPAPPAANPVVDPELRERTTAGRTVRVNVVTKSRTDLPDAANAGRVLQRLSRLPVVTLRADAAALDRLAAQPGVVSVTEDVPVPPVATESVPLVGADRTRAAGRTGQGTVVAVLDTGVAVNHPFFGGRVIAQNCFSTADPYYSATSLCPNGTERQEGPGAADAEQGPCAALDCSHGTHVAGIAAGDGGTTAGAPPGGVAPSAQIIAMQVFSRINSESLCGVGAAPCVLSFTSAQLGALERVLQYKESGLPVAAANLSLGSGRNTAACDHDPRKPVIDRLLAAGVATVAAAGNNAFGDAVNAPSCISSAITVGSTTDQDEMSAFSNRGPLLDLVAPGSAIVSAVPGGGWGTKNGTSMAAPHVSGALAVLRQAFPAKSVAELETLLKTTGRPIEYTGVRSTPRLRLGDAALGPESPAPKPLTFYDDWTHRDIPDLGSVEAPLTIASNQKAPSTLQVYVDLHHARIGDLKLDLIAPDGTAYPVRAPSPTDLRDTLHETFTVDAGASDANGIWKLRIEDTVAGATGRSEGWRLTFPWFDNWSGHYVPDPGVLESPIAVGSLAGNAPAATKVYVDIHHAHRGELKLDLIAPDGRVYPLQAAAPLDGTDNYHATYTVDASASPASGTWKLRVEDVTAGNPGNVVGWTLTF
ncbi:S8 family serine peptidase [Streptomyces yaizuensis]|uniref:S8 family serine peptidase n=1 Tax=Streptomyces yaizuensis TaxID=2989713 RepID=A0ABQ5NQV4_9ACTN|nr:S8 family serine peptidase [Streptomyces sp. YSPA8]GLF92759.1 S8 family serine peptidase [Streptomyces sp. YSPA8]